MQVYSGTFKFIVPPANMSPRVWFSPKTWFAIKKFVALVSTECHWYCTVYHNPDENYYYIDNFHIPEQEVSGTTVESSAAQYALLLNEIKDEYNSIEDLDQRLQATNNHFRKLSCWGHSHVDMGCTPSSTDEQNTREWVKSFAEGNNSAQPFIMMIMNKKGELYLRVIHPDTKISFENPPVYLDFDNPYEQYIKDSISEKVKKKIYTSTYVGHGVHGLNHTSETNGIRWTTDSDVKKNTTALTTTTTVGQTTAETSAKPKRIEDESIFNSLQELINKVQLALAPVEKQKSVFTNILKFSYSGAKNLTGLTNLSNEINEKLQLFYPTSLVLTPDVIHKYVDVLDDMFSLHHFGHVTDAHSFLQTFKNELAGNSPKTFSYPTDFIEVSGTYPILTLLPFVLAITHEEQDQVAISKICDLIWSINKHRLLHNSTNDWAFLGENV